MKRKSTSIEFLRSFMQLPCQQAEALVCSLKKLKDKQAGNTFTDSELDAFLEAISSFKSPVDASLVGMFAAIVPVLEQLNQMLHTETNKEFINFCSR